MSEYRRIIEESIAAAESLKTKLPDEIFLIPGYSSKMVRILLNSVVEKMNDSTYLEIGSFRGSTLVSALYKNAVKDAYAVDNWSEFNDGTVRDDFLLRTEKYLSNSFKLIEGDCFSDDVISKIKPGINVFFFDGEHSYESHYSALIRYIDLLSKDFIFIVDDFDPYDASWENVERGTRDSIECLALKVNYEVHLKSTGRNSESSWWNGIYIAHISK